MVYSMTDEPTLTDTEFLRALVSRLRSTGPYFDEQLNEMNYRTPNHHDCHNAADAIEGLLIYKSLAEKVVKLHFGASNE